MENADDVEERLDPVSFIGVTSPQNLSEARIDRIIERLNMLGVTSKAHMKLKSLWQQRLNELLSDTWSPPSVQPISKGPDESEMELWKNGRGSDGNR